MRKISFLEGIYSYCFACETSQELLWYVKKNKYYFEKLPPKAQEQIREEYRRMREKEKFDFK